MYSVTNHRGFVPQNEQFEDREMVGEDIKSYKIIEYGEFAYNPARINVGSIARYIGSEPCMISSLYVCFKPSNEIDGSFLMQFLKSPKANFYYNANGEGGVRIYLFYPNFARIRTAIPSLSEQRKISSLLSIIDERITTQRRLIEDFISLRRAILQGAIKRGLSKKSWKYTTLNDILTERGEKNSNGYDVFSVSVSEGVVNQIEYLGRSFAAKETGYYNVARYGDIIYTKSPTGSFPYGIVKRDTQKEPSAISPLYGVFVPKCDWIGILLGYYFESEVNTFNYLHPIIQKGAKNTINITNSGFLANSVPLPTDESEALTLAKCLDTISNKIVLEKSVLAHYTEQREYLLSKMFV